jgi:uncharacterized protein
VTAARLVDLAEIAVRLGRLLHAAGVPVTPERGGRFAEALQVAAPATADELYWVARVTLVTERRDLGTFDRVFAQVFGGLVDPGEQRGQPSAPPPAHVRPGPAGPTRRDGVPGGTSARPAPVPIVGAGDDGDDALDTVVAAVSEEERLRQRDFATLTPDEHARIRILVGRLAVAPPPRRARRHVRHPSGDRVDLRATLAAAHRTGGDPVRTVRRRHRTRPRRVVLLCDVSGSMEPYARAYLHLAHAAVVGADAEAFVFATRLTRLTRALRDRRPDEALRRAGTTAEDWAGGTRIGAALRRFNDEHGRRGTARGAVVVVVSDGWEREAPELVGREVERLARLAHRVIWVNPRAANPRFAPLVAGMAAALPHVDELLSGHSVAALEEVVEAIARARHRRP